MKNTYIIAEIGGNFTTYEQAIRLIDEASFCGADAVKLQTYRAKTVTSQTAMFYMENITNYSQFLHFKTYEIDEELHKKIFSYAKSKGIDIFSTPSHFSDVEMLERIGCSAYKIGSDDAVNHPFLRQVSALGKPIILATGMCTMEEVRESVSVILGAGCSDLKLLHAVTAYPTHAEDVNLRAMQSLIREFPELCVGYSDHTIGSTAAICAVAMGAQIIEKHFTLDKNSDGPDHMLSANPAEFLEIVQSIRRFEVMLGSGVKMPAAGEAVTRKNNRKSVIITKLLSSGDVLTWDNIDIKRPGTGIEPRYFEQLLGRRVGRDMKEDEVLCWNDLI